MARQRDDGSEIRAVIGCVGIESRGILGARKVSRAMADSKTLSIDPAIYDRLADQKRASETWNELFGRLLGATEEGQVHLDRSTLADFGDDEEVLETDAADDGTVEVRVHDSDGTVVGSTTVHTLAPNEPVTVEIAAPSE